RAQDDPGLEVHQARRVRVQVLSPQPVEFDGEEGGQSRELSVEVVPRAVLVLLPEGAPAVRDVHRGEPPTVAARKSAERRLLTGAAITALLVGTVVVGTRLWQ